MINRLIKNFLFDEKIRKDLIFSDPTKIRLNTEDPLFPRIELKSDAAGNFSLDSDIFIETPLTNPQSVTSWLRFEDMHEELAAGTSLQYKIKTTLGNYFWNGSSWTLAGLSDWSLAQDINSNFQSFPISDIGNKSIGFVINLKTTDVKQTPRLREIKFLGLFDIDYLEDIIYDGVIRKLNTEFRSTSVVVFAKDTSSNLVDLNTVLENKGYNIVAIRRVVNLTDDALKLQNLVNTYSPGLLRKDGFTFDPGIVTLSQTINAGKLLEVTFEYVPEILINTGQDYFESPKFPSVIFETIEKIDRRGFTLQDKNSYGKDVIRNLTDLTGVLQFGPTQKTIRFEFAIYTNLQIDQMRLSQDLAEFFSRNKTLKSYGLDREYDLDIVEELNTNRTMTKRDAGGDQDMTDTNIATGSFDVLGVLFYNKPSIDVPLVGEGQVNINVTV